MTTTKIIEAVGLIAEVCGQEGPTGKLREVLVVAVVDYGGNEFARATTPRGVARIQSRMRIPTRLQAVKLGNEVRPDAHVAGYTVDCGLCD